MSKLAAEFGVVILLSAACAGVVGCSSVPRVETGERGLFQPPVAMATGNGMSVHVPQGTIQKSDAGFIWPLREGKVTSLFGTRRRDYHEGIDIRANRGNAIFAVRDGVVIYSSRRIRGYGNMVVVKHEDGWATVYAHNKKNLVKRGERVTQGQLVGYVGSTGKSTGPHLHFEIRKGELPHDPLLYLPQLREPAVAQHGNVSQSDN